MWSSRPVPIGRRGTRACRPRPPLASTCLAVILVLGFVTGAPAETWRGLVVAPEHRCAPYDKKRDYPYPQSVEADIVRALGAVYGPYTGTCFSSTSDTDIEHIVAASEAHDSGLCAADADDPGAVLSRDLRNLTLASPKVNGYEKRGKDAAEWIPRPEQVLVRREGRLRSAWRMASSIDRREAAGARRHPFRVRRPRCSSPCCLLLCLPSSGAGAAFRPCGRGRCARALYDDNGNGRITCAEARRHGIAPVPRSHPAYRYMRDGDGDGVVCE